MNCQNCNFETKNNKELLEHKKSHAKKGFKCDQCDYVAGDINVLKSHKMISMNHSTGIKYMKTNNRCQCNKCYNFFDTKHALDSHMSTVHKSSEERIKCNLCDFSAINNDILQKHMQVAMGHKLDTICKYFLRGHCMKGKFCRFKHPLPSNDKEQNLNPHRTKYFQSREENIKYQNKPVYTKQCKYMENCFKFPNCGFLHKEVCKFQDKCLNKQNCNFVHLSRDSFLGGNSRMNQ